MTVRTTRWACLVAGLLAACSRAATAPTPAATMPAASPPAAAVPLEPPMKLAPRPTSSAISAADLMTRLYIFADDSMEGREFGERGNEKGTAYIERELRRLGLEPAGENGTFFQVLPTHRRSFDPATRFGAVPPGTSRAASFRSRPMMARSALIGPPRASGPDA